MAQYALNAQSPLTVVDGVPYYGTPSRDAEEMYSKPLHGRIHNDRTNPDSDYAIQEVWSSRNFDPTYMNVWPLPTTVIEGAGIPQNIGW